MIHHLSYPKGDSVNDFIPVEFSAVQYTQVKDTIAGIKRFKAPCFLTKCDIKMAHKNLPLAPKDYHLFGFKWLHSEGCYNPVKHNLSLLHIPSNKQLKYPGVLELGALKRKFGMEKGCIVDVLLALGIPDGCRYALLWPRKECLLTNWDDGLYAPPTEGNVTPPACKFQHLFAGCDLLHA